MYVEESPNDQTPEKVCSHTQLGAMPWRMILQELIKQYHPIKTKTFIHNNCIENLIN